MKQLIRLKWASFVNMYHKKITSDGIITGIQAIAVFSACIYFTYTGSFDTPGETVTIGKESAPEMIATGNPVLTLPNSLNPSLIRVSVRIPNDNFSLPVNYRCFSNQAGLTSLGYCVDHKVVEGGDGYLQEFVYKGLRMRSQFSKSRFIHASSHLHTGYKFPVLPDLIYAKSVSHLRYQ